LASIEFPAGAPKLTARGTVAFPVVILGSRASAEITAEALEDHFGASNWSPETLANAFDQHRLEIQKVARDRIVARWAEGRALLTSEDF
jgi:hypothetical protein